MASRNGKSFRVAYLEEGDEERKPAAIAHSRLRHARKPNDKHGVTEEQAAEIASRSTYAPEAERGKLSKKFQSIYKSVEADNKALIDEWMAHPEKRGPGFAGKVADLRAAAQHLKQLGDKYFTPQAEDGETGRNRKNASDPYYALASAPTNFPGKTAENSPYFTKQKLDPNLKGAERDRAAREIQQARAELGVARGRFAEAVNAGLIEKGTLTLDGRAVPLSSHAQAYTIANRTANRIASHVADRLAGLEPVERTRPPGAEPSQGAYHIAGLGPATGIMENPRQIRTEQARLGREERREEHGERERRHEHEGARRAIAVRQPMLAAMRSE